MDFNGIARMRLRASDRARYAKMMQQTLNKKVASLLNNTASAWPLQNTRRAKRVTASVGTDNHPIPIMTARVGGPLSRSYFPRSGSLQMKDSQVGRRPDGTNFVR